jgi:hypothetical protein
MIFRNMLQNLYEVDSTLGSPATPTPETSQDRHEDKGEDEKVTLTQRELNRIALKEAKNAKASAEKAFLDALGVGNLDEIKAMLTAHREKQEAEKSESQKLLDALNAAKQETAAALQKATELEKKNRLDKRDSNLKALLMAKANDADDVLLLMKGAHGDKLDALLDEDGNFDNEAAVKLVTEYQTAKPHLFKDMSLGSAMSHKDGKAPQPNEEARKALQIQVSKSLKGF